MGHTGSRPTCSASKNLNYNDDQVHPQPKSNGCIHQDRKFMDRSTLEITDQEFVEQYRSLNVFHRKIICEACLKSFDEGNEEIKRSIGVEITYQYVSLLEDLAMIFFALKDIDKYSGSFVKSLHKISIKENSQTYSTEALITEVSRLLSLPFDDLLAELHLPDFDEIKVDLDLTTEEIENIDSLRSEYELEIQQAIKKIVSNRKIGKDGKIFDLVKIGNKIKHGTMFLLNHDDEAVFYPLTIKADNNTKINIAEGYYVISSKKESLELMIKNMDSIGNLMSDLLLIFSKKAKN